MVEYEVQKAIKTTLDAIMPISGVGTVPVHDHVPQDTDPPFIVIGADSAQYADTKLEQGMAHTVEIDIYSSYRGFAEVKRIMGAIYTALHWQSITVTGYEATRAKFVSSIEFEEPEGTRGTQRFELLTFN